MSLALSRGENSHNSTRVYPNILTCSIVQSNMCCFLWFRLIDSGKTLFSAEKHTHMHNCRQDIQSDFTFPSGSSS